MGRCLFNLYCTYASERREQENHYQIGGGGGCWQVCTMVGRYFLAQYTKTRENLPTYHCITKWPWYIPNDHKIFQMTIKYFKWRLTIPAFSILGPSKIYPNWDFWSENKPSVNPGVHYTCSLRCLVSWWRHFIRRFWNQTLTCRIKVFYFSTGISETVARRFLLQKGSNTTTISSHHCHHFPTLSLEHLSLPLKSNFSS
jgi:hypothetical protein